MRRYEAMVILSGDMDADELNSAVEVVRKEVEAAGGTVDNITRMGKRTFARILQSPRRLAEGYYVLYELRLDPAKVDALRGRLALRDEVYRVQIVRTAEREQAAGPDRGGDESGEAVAAEADTR
ncbi:MAG TPA: 30S ribosomal protein S6 [Kiritimatiellae bacterium]|nr:30S ribosomal protein S6 [Kiritimatiellia bacterium]